MDIRLSSGKSIDVLDGENILQALKRHGIYLVASCGGKGTCGKCRVRIYEGEYRTDSRGKIEPHDGEKGVALACQTFPRSDLMVDIPKESRLSVGDAIEVAKSQDLFELFKFLGGDISPLVKSMTLEMPPPTIDNNIADLERLRRSIEESGGPVGIRFSLGFVSALSRSLRDAGWKVELGYTEGREAVSISAPGETGRYGIAVDIGTTTIVVYLVDLKAGALIDVGSTYNSQIRHGDDVITRIVFATEGGGLDELRETVVGDINDLIAPILERHAITAAGIQSAVISANTTMSHLFWGLTPAFIREEPYVPAVNAFPLWKGYASRLSVSQQAPVYTVPCVASYVGGDIVAGVLASKMHRSEEISLFMDIGTNGEIVIGNREWLVTAACSAGPCFEGSGIKHGMRATEGAVESVKIDPRTFEPSLGVIGSGRPVGICGSGMIDAITEMFLTGVIDQRGRFVKEAGAGRIRGGVDGPEFLFYEDEHRNIVLTEVDIENIMRAKAAIYAGISLLIKKVGFGLDDIGRVYIAGGFGNYLDVEKAIVIGMLPDMAREKFVFLGNSSIAGAYLCLLSAQMRSEAEEIAGKMTNIELSVSRRFMDEYMSALFLPHTDIAQFPTVDKLLRQKR